MHHHEESQLLTCGFCPRAGDAVLRLHLSPPSGVGGPWLGGLEAGRGVLPGRLADEPSAGLHPDNSNSYDNEMIKRALIWAVKRYDIVGVNEWNKNFNLKNTGYSPSLLSRPIQ